MVVMCTTTALVLSRMLGSVGQVGPVRERLVRNTRGWAYSKMAITLDVHVNLIIFAVSAVFLVCTVGEKPNVPVRVYVAGYAVQCLVHAVLVWFEYQRRSRRSQGEIELEAEIRGRIPSQSILTNDDDDGNVRVRVRVGKDGRIFIVLDGASFAYGGDTVNMFVAAFWLNIGFYWVLSGGKLLSQNAPWLYWLTMVYQNYDFTFVGFCLAVWLSLYRIIAILNIVAGQEGASEEDVNVLPEYRSHISSNGEKPSVGAGVMVPMDTGSGDLATECALLPENAECCICLCSNDDGIDLHALSCNHRFHATCIEKWLIKMNATCPLCKFNILKESV